jgi:hypothetical protein
MYPGALMTDCCHDMWNLVDIAAGVLNADRPLGWATMGESFPWRGRTKIDRLVLSTACSQMRVQTARDGEIQNYQ